MKGFTTAAALAGILMLGAATAGTMSSDSTMTKSEDGMAHSSAMHHKDAMAPKPSMSHGTMSGPGHNAMSSSMSHGTMSGPSHGNAMSSGHMTAHTDKKKDKMNHSAMSGSSMSHTMMAKPN